MDKSNNNVLFFYGLNIFFFVKIEISISLKI